MTTRTTHPTLTVGTRTYQRRGDSGCWHRQAPVGIGLGWLPVHDIATSNLLDEVERLRGLASAIEFDPAIVDEITRTAFVTLARQHTPGGDAA